MRAAVLISLSLISSINCLKCSPECRSDAVCCSEQSCANNAVDSDFPQYKVCECMIGAGDQCVNPGAELSLDCDPGGQCVDHCSWDTPVGECSWSRDKGLQCEDSSISVLDTSSGQCSLLVSDPQSRHSGVWRCKVTPSINSFIGSLPQDWYVRGWRAGLLWSGVGVLILILIVIIITIIVFCCPAVCLCCPWCAKRYQDTQEQGVHYTQVRRDHRNQRRTRRRSSSVGQSPVIIHHDQRQFSSNHQEIFDRRVDNHDDYLGNRRVGHRDDDQDHRRGGHMAQDHPDNIEVEYEVPRIYASSVANLKSARKKSNFSNINLEERIRRASGVGRHAQV